MTLWMDFHQTCIDTLFGGEKSNKILMALALFLWSHNYFVISISNQMCVSACYIFK